MDTSLTNILMWTSSGTNPPAGPIGLAATTTSAQIQLLWHDSVGATSYKLKRSTSSGGPFTNIITTTSATNYTDSSAVTGPTYYYVVSALDSFGESTNSSPASASLSPSPQLSITTSAFRSGNLALSGTGGLSGKLFYVLTSTNLALAQAQWTPIATDSFDNNGTFTFTTTQAPNRPQLYYKLQTP
jgi:fibronectin type 3 domain-containing protein